MRGGKSCEGAPGWPARSREAKLPGTGLPGVRLRRFGFSKERMRGGEDLRSGECEESAGLGKSRSARQWCMCFFARLFDLLRD